MNCPRGFKNACNKSQPLVLESRNISQYLTTDWISTHHMVSIDVLAST
jgi:hypothetical protein